MSRYAKVAVTLPPEVLEAADRLARAQDRSRSWIVAEALRRYLADPAWDGPALDRSRRVQLARDVALPVAERLRLAEDEGGDGIASVPAVGAALPDAPRRFASYEEFAAWRRARRGG